MPCFKPLQAFFLARPDGKKQVCFSEAKARIFYGQNKNLITQDSLSIPCGRCMGCRLEKSRQWAMRCIHEASMYEKNVFITLTYNDENLPKDGSLDKKVMQKFIKKLRQHYKEQKIRVFYCGEYGEKNWRPHYHAIIFNLDFDDKLYWKSIVGNRYYTSPTLSKLWSYGFSTISDVTFDSAAYVARYATKKITGEQAKEHYKRVSDDGEVYYLVPEFCQASLKPGIGTEWLKKYGETDVYPRDEVIVRGVRCKPPRYYDKQLEKADPEAYERLKERRKLIGEKRQDDNLFSRLQVKEKCQAARMKRLIRKMEI